MITPTTSSFLLPSFPWFLFLLVVLPIAYAADVSQAVTWSAKLQNRIEDMDKNTLHSQNVISMLNGFQSLNPPERETPDSKWVDLLSSEVSSLMQSRADAARKLALEIERLYALEEEPAG